MKFAVVLFALVAVAVSAPQPKKIFHENFEDFLDLIQDEIGDEMDELLEEYIQYDEFLATLNYFRDPNFRNLVYEMEDLPEFKAVVDFLNTHSIDISFFIDLFNDSIDNVNNRKARQSASGKDFTSFIKDVTAMLPQDKLDALYQEKLAEDADFSAAIDGILSDEFQDLWDALWASPVFLAEVQTLADNGIELGALLDELVAIFGQAK